MQKAIDSATVRRVRACTLRQEGRDKGHWKRCKIQKRGRLDGGGDERRKHSKARWKGSLKWKSTQEQEKKYQGGEKNRKECPIRLSQCVTF